MELPIQLVVVWDDRDNTEMVTAVLYGSMKDITDLARSITTENREDIAFDSWSEYDAKSPIITEHKGYSFALFDFAIGEEYSGREAVRGVQSYLLNKINKEERL